MTVLTNLGGIAAVRGPELPDTAHTAPSVIVQVVVDAQHSLESGQVGSASATVTVFYPHMKGGSAPPTAVGVLQGELEPVFGGDLTHRGGQDVGINVGNQEGVMHR